MQKEKGQRGGHHMGWRSRINDYSRKGLYHITIKVADRSSQVLGVVEGNPNVPIGHEGAAYVRLTALGFSSCRHGFIHIGGQTRPSVWLNAKP